jgi:hypothetical protein
MENHYENKRISKNLEKPSPLESRPSFDDVGRTSDPSFGSTSKKREE